jgi:hypothetical protein
MTYETDKLTQLAYTYFHSNSKDICNLGKSEVHVKRLKALPYVMTAQCQHKYTGKECQNCPLKGKTLLFSIVSNPKD